MSLSLKLLCRLLPSAEIQAALSALRPSVEALAGFVRAVPSVTVGFLPGAGFAGCGGPRVRGVRAVSLFSASSPNTAFERDALKRAPQFER